ncbi:MAG: CpaF family protein, partial [Verrucomicrobiota bacterium]
MDEGIRRRLHQTVLSHLDARRAGLSFAQDVDRCRRRAEEILRVEMCSIPLDAGEKQQIAQGILDEIFFYGPISPLLSDPSVTEIMVNGSESIYLERDGRLLLHDRAFLSEESLR